MTDHALAPIAVSCGEPAGVGPEIAVEAWAALKEDVPFFWVGDPRHLPDGTPFQEIDAPEDSVEVCRKSFPVLPHPFPKDAVPGQPTAENAASVVEVLMRSVDLVKAGEASAICTAPIAKSVLAEWADFPYPGHTEFLAALANADRVVMMLAADELKVVPTTIHIPLSEVPNTLTRDLLEETIRITAAALTRDFGIVSPRLAVSGLNPHAGEDGMLGPEESGWIAPLLDGLRAEGFNLKGPMPGDTMFHAKARDGYDAAIAMYHDQALIPIKTLAFDRGVNVTLGLPFVRTSPDHGTAFDIAGKAQANPTSMIEALKLAQRMARARVGK